MPLTFPLSRGQFFSLLPISQITFDLPEVVSHSRTRGGDILSADIGDRLWMGEITLGRMTRSEYAEVRPIIDLLRGAGTSFLIHDPTRPYARADDGAAQLGLATPQIGSLPGPRELTISGLPAGYVLSREDMLGFRYGPSPRRYALHQVVTGGVANGSGATPPIEVVPPIEPGAVVGEPVVLVRPACKAKIVPGSVNAARAGAVLREGASFRWCQTHR